MAISFFTGAISIGFSWLLPFIFGGIVTASFTYFGYQWGVRQRAHQDYTMALENLIGCLDWVLGQQNKAAVYTKVKDVEAIVNMINTLAPLTNTKQLRAVLADDIEDAVIASGEPAAANVRFLDDQLKEEHLNLYYRVYGYQQGGFLDFFNGLLYTIKNMFSGLGKKGEPAPAAPDHGKGAAAPAIPALESVSKDAAASVAPGSAVASGQLAQDASVPVSVAEPEPGAAGAKANVDAADVAPLSITLK